MAFWLERLQNAKTKVSRARKTLVPMDVLDDLSSTCYKGENAESAQFFPEFREGPLGFIGEVFVAFEIIY